MKVYKNKFGNWEILAKNNLPNGETIYYNLQVQFKKGKEPKEDKIDLKADDYFFSCFLKRDNTTAPKLVIMDWVEIEPKKIITPEGTETTVDEYKASKNIEISTEELPFY